MVEICRRVPTTLTELKAIGGFGHIRATKHHTWMLPIVTSYIATHSIALKGTFAQSDARPGVSPAAAPPADRPPSSASVSSAAAASSKRLSASPSRRRSMGVASASAAAAPVDEYEYECPTCWEDVAFEACVSCSEGHLVCSDCLKRHAEENLFAKHHSQLDCLSKNDSGAKCGGFYSHAMLARSLPDKMLQRHAAASAKEAVDALGGLENLVSCPHCDWTAELPATNRVLKCGNPACKKETCRYCRKASHIPLRCDEVKEKKKTDARTVIEERMTAARLRKCWGCKLSFFKTEGCNKMTCPKCQKSQCYMCSEKIIVAPRADGAPPALLPNGRPACYAHFCEVPHCDHSSCGKCRLFENSTELEDLKRVRDAGISAAQALRAQASASTLPLHISCESFSNLTCSPPPQYLVHFSHASRAGECRAQRGRRRRERRRYRRAGRHGQAPRWNGAAAESGAEAEACSAAQRAPERSRVASDRSRDAAGTGSITAAHGTGSITQTGSFCTNGAAHGTGTGSSTGCAGSITGSVAQRPCCAAITGSPQAPPPQVNTQ